MKAAHLLALPVALAAAGCAGTSPIGDSPADARRARVVSWEKQCEDRGLARNTLDFGVCVDGYAAAASQPPPAPITGD